MILRETIPGQTQKMLKINKNNLLLCTECAAGECKCIECCGQKFLCAKKVRDGKCTWNSDADCFGFRLRED